VVGRRRVRREKAGGKVDGKVWEETEGSWEGGVLASA
jgi:hypothetical protein